ncbi:MAG: cytochrome b N-terminal domain-containing protein [Betaproteobacteria bacterium]|nr:cytochrome b N-terminal domain-containing protein [Betaproteobacteria bacterium]
MLRKIQRAGQWLFMHVEGPFNLAFGNQLNPFYYLGAISYFMFWIVVVSGLYLYIFFSTSVEGAYDSVEAITHGQWYFGGIMRSFHRYASDGMVLTMGLHLTRHFFFDHYRGFRWFSWVSGVVLLWLVYASGINGFMLPWDSTAQFVVIATAEWLDVLPMFNGILIRNFIFEGQVNDRLFSLLSFIHIGFPLGVLALLWVHTQRVPRAKTNPPLPIMLMVITTLVVLSLLKPVLSGPRANLDAALQQIDFDWFYLPAYALIYELSPAKTWMIVLGASLFVLVLPWLPPKRRSGPKQGFHLLVQPDDRIIGIRDGETVLDAALREGVALPFDCRNGGCSECKCRLLHGKVDYGPHHLSALSTVEKSAGYVLTCCATALSDVEIVYEPRAGVERPPLQVHTARVERMNRLSEDVMQIFLRVEGGAKVKYYAGQYINILLEDGQKRAYSFATAPHHDTTIELQIRYVPGGKFTTQVFEHMQVGDIVRFEGPVGSFFLREDSVKPIIFVAGATGFAPVKSMLEYAFEIGLKREMYLYWGVRKRKDLYLPDLPEQWAKDHANFHFIPVLSDAGPEDAWTGRSGLVHEAILADFPDLGGYQVYACGSVGMVEAAKPAFLARGMVQDDCFSDAFRLAPHRSVDAPSADMVKLGGQQ